MTCRPLLWTSAALLVAGCQPSGTDGTETGAAAMPDPQSSEAYDGIGEHETLHFTGTEPFWAGEVTAGSLKYSTPDDPDGTTIAVARFAGRGGLSFGGRFEGESFEMAVTPLECSDGMSDRSYPFTITLRIGADLRQGCGWTERQPFSGPANP